MPTLEPGVNVSTVPKCQAAMEQLSSSVADLIKQIECVEGRFASVLAVAPLSSEWQEEDVPICRQRSLAEEISGVAGLVRRAADRIRSLIERCEL